MKTQLLYLTVKLEVESGLENLSETVQEFEQNTTFSFSDTQHVKVTHTELLATETFNL